MGHWLVYWFMLPACVLIAGTATFSGISGAALLTPVFLIGFPLLGVPRLGTVEAIGTSLFLETSGFGAAVCRYLRLRLVDLGAARSLIAVTLPAGALGAVLARYAPVQGLRLGYGAAMLAVRGCCPARRAVAAAPRGRAPAWWGSPSVPRGSVPSRSGGRWRPPTALATSTACGAWASSGPSPVSGH